MCQLIKEIPNDYDSQSKLGMLCLALGFFTIGFMIGTYKSNAEVVKCEQSLPRDQHCKIVAIPNKEV